MTWARTAKRYLGIFEAEAESAMPGKSRAAETIASGREPCNNEPTKGGPSKSERAVPEIRVGHFLSLCDGTGLIQHAVHSVPDRSHGYCVDDNARALLLSNALAEFGETQLPASVTSRFAAFIQHAWNPDTRRFRNFMSYDRRWLEDRGSEDSHGRTLWALAECARTDTDPSLRTWSAALFETALPVVEDFTSPRAWAFSLLGLNAYCARFGSDVPARRLRTLLADRLTAMITRMETRDWTWFEEVLAYDNARLPQALIQTGLATRMPSYIEVGLRSLRWLTAHQTSSSGYFRPVGTKSFGNVRRKPEAFDQQPLEATATISACVAAWRADHSAGWLTEAHRAFGWFLGENDLQTPIADPDTGGCMDGIHPKSVNKNRGAESVLSYLLGLVEIREFNRVIEADRTKSVKSKSDFAGVDLGDASPRTIAGSVIDRIPPHETPALVSAPGPLTGRHSTVQTGNGATRLQPHR
jgi:hypothetical protein